MFAVLTKENEIKCPRWPLYTYVYIFMRVLEASVGEIFTVSLIKVNSYGIIIKVMPESSKQYLVSNK